MVSLSPDKGRMREVVSLVETFGLGVAFVVDPADDSPSSILGASERAGVQQF
jgi:hypothetical protein